MSDKMMEALERIANDTYGDPRSIARDALAATTPSRPVTAGAMDDGPCFYCGEQTCNAAGDPGRWPLQFCQPDGTGITKFHHTRCVTDRLAAPPAAPCPSVIDFLKQWDSRESLPVINVVRDMVREWPKFAAAQPASPAAGREEIARILNDHFRCGDPGEIDAIKAATKALLRLSGSVTWKKLTDLWQAIAGGPEPRCRDCADFNGRCQGNGLPCDPQERALEQVAKLRAASALTPHKLGAAPSHPVEMSNATIADGLDEYRREWPSLEAPTADLLNCAAQRLRATPPAPGTADRERNLRRLVIAARTVCFDNQSSDAIRALDKASEAFSELVAWENDPNDESVPANTGETGR